MRALRKTMRKPAIASVLQSAHLAGPDSSLHQHLHQHEQEQPHADHAVDLKERAIDARQIVGPHQPMLDRKSVV